MRLHEPEPEFRGDRRVALRTLVDELVGALDLDSGPYLLAIDGRSSNGKSTLAARMARVTPGAEVVHTDDLAWWHSRFGWEDLLVAGVIEPLRRGEDVSYRPPAWEARGRMGRVAVNAAAPLVIIEGVGSGRRSLRPLLDGVIWVQSDLEITDARNQARVAAGELDQAGYDGWMAEEVPFQAAERTWDRADVVVSGTPSLEHEPDNDVIVLAADLTRR